MKRAASFYGAEARMRSNFANAIGNGYKFNQYQWNKTNNGGKYGNYGVLVNPGESVSQDLPPNMRTLGITVVNAATASNIAFTMFDGFADPTDANLNANITITPQNGLSNPFLKREISSNPYIVVGAKYTVDTLAQLSNAWVYSVQDITGYTGSYRINPNASSSANNQQTLKVDMADVAMRLDGKSSLTLTANANEQLDFQFFIKGRIVIGNAAAGVSVAEQTIAPPPTGNFAFDFQQPQAIDPANFGHFNRRRIM